MDEPEVLPMSNERVIEALRELKRDWLARSPSKYFFALGRAIRELEDTDES